MVFVYGLLHCQKSLCQSPQGCWFHHGQAEGEPAEVTCWKENILTPGQAFQRFFVMLKQPKESEGGLTFSPVFNPAVSGALEGLISRSEGSVSQSRIITLSRGHSNDN